MHVLCWQRWCPLYIFVAAIWIVSTVIAQENAGFQQPFVGSILAGNPAAQSSSTTPNVGPHEALFPLLRPEGSVDSVVSTQLEPGAPGLEPVPPIAIRTSTPPATEYTPSRSLSQDGSTDPAGSSRLKPEGPGIDPTAVLYRSTPPVPEYGPLLPLSQAGSVDSVVPKPLPTTTPEFEPLPAIVFPTSTPSAHEYRPIRPLSQDGFVNSVIPTQNTGGLPQPGHTYIEPNSNPSTDGFYGTTPSFLPLDPWGILEQGPALLPSPNPSQDQYPLWNQQRLQNPFWPVRPFDSPEPKPEPEPERNQQRPLNPVWPIQQTNRISAPEPEETPTTVPCWICCCSSRRAAANLVARAAAGVRANGSLANDALPANVKQHSSYARRTSLSRLGYC